MSEPYEIPNYGSRQIRYDCWWSHAVMISIDFW